MSESPAPTAATTTLYICEASGSDSTGIGTPTSPLLTPVAALQKGGPSTVIMVRKKADEEYVALGTSALKKAKKAVEIAEKKANKAKEAEANDRDKAEKDAKRLEESKKIVLEEDASLPKATKVCLHPYPRHPLTRPPRILVRVFANVSLEHHRARSKASMPSDRNAFASQAGSIVSASKRNSHSSSSEMAPVSCSASCPESW